VEYADGVRRSEYSCRSPILPLSLDEDTAQHRGYEMHRLGVIRLRWTPNAGQPEPLPKV
jgi:hypothetical protein